MKEIKTSLAQGTRVFVRAKNPFYGRSGVVLYRAPGVTWERYDVGFDDGTTDCFQRKDLVLPESQTAQRFAALALTV